MPNITHLIFHKLNLQNENRIYSDTLIDLEQIEDGDVALSFFKHHITINRNTGHTKTCRFENTQAAHVKSAATHIYEALSNDSQDILDDTLIEQSRILIDHLATSMLGKSQSEGTLFTIIYTYENINYLGLLKMDPNDGIEITDDMNIIVREDLLPGINEKLHKSAFIKLKQNYSTDESDLYVLDRQQRQDNVARFFMHDFLQAREIANDTNQTKAIVNLVKDYFVEIIENPHERASFYKDFQQTLDNIDSFVIDRDLEAIAEPYISDSQNIHTIQDSILNELRNKFPDATPQINIDKEALKGTEFKSPDGEVKITIQSSVPKEDYRTKTNEDGEFVIIFNGDLNISPI